MKALHVGVRSRFLRGSGQTSSSSANSSSDYYAASSNRLSSNSTLPSTDTPRTPDDYRHPESSSSYSTFAGAKAQSSGTGGSSAGTALNPPAVSTVRSPMTVPKLETTLDTSSLFGDEMFEFSGSRKDSSKDEAPSSPVMGTPTVPKIASSSIMSRPVCFFFFFSYFSLFFNF